MQNRNLSKINLDKDLDIIEIAPSLSTDTVSVVSLKDLNSQFLLGELQNESRCGTPTDIVRRWSQHLTKLEKGKKNGHRKQSLCKRPSSRFCKRSRFTLNDTQEIEELSKEIEQHEVIMQGNSTTNEQHRINTLRSLPFSLLVKKKVKRRLSLAVTDQSTSVSPFKDAVSRSYMFALLILTKAKQAFKSIEVWYESIKSIEGHLGSEIGIYFSFLRYILILNLFALLTILGFVIIPEIFIGSIQTVNRNNTNTTSYRKINVIDFFTGKGYLEDSLLFFGAYSNATIITKHSNYYSIPQSYFMTMFCIYIVTFIILSISMARSYRKSFIEASGCNKTEYARMVLCAWHFGISNERSARIKHLTIFNSFKHILKETVRKDEKHSCLYYTWMIAARVTVHIIVFCVLVGIGVSLWIFVKKFNRRDDSIWSSMSIPLLILTITPLLHVFFKWITSMEDYKSTQKMLYLNTIRSFLVNVITFSVLVSYWISEASHRECWETYIGQEIYRFVLIDFLITIIILTIYRCIRTLVFRKYYHSLARTEFDIPQASLQIIFNQALLWFGMLFSPLLPALVIFKIILIFYIQKYTVIHYCKLPCKLWKASEAHTLYIVITFLSIVGIIVAHGYIITQVPVSKDCGPFRDHTYIFQIFVQGVLALRANHWIWKTIMAISRPAVMGGILLAMSVIVYYLRAKSRARRIMVKLLKDMLYLEARDKEYLLLNISRLSNGKEWMFDETTLNKTELKQDNYTESSSTWKFANGNTSGDTFGLQKRFS